MTDAPRRPRTLPALSRARYFDAGTVEQARALSSVAAECAVGGSRHERLVGPHPRWAASRVQRQFDGVVARLDNGKA
jgi:hypothetical protein